MSGNYRHANVDNRCMQRLAAFLNSDSVGTHTKIATNKYTYKSGLVQ